MNTLSKTYNTPFIASLVLGSVLMAGCAEDSATKAANTAPAEVAKVESTQNDLVESIKGIDKFNAYTQQFTEETTITKPHATGHVGNNFFTHWKDGGAASLTMDLEGNFSVSWEGGGYNYVGGPGWHNGDKDRVIGFRFDNDDGANYLTLYGWGYDKEMPKSDPAHLVEYYILQRWTHDPSRDGELGVTFTSAGTEYTTYRTIREEKPSVNSISTFYQYWSLPSKQVDLGQEGKIIFADHVKAWEESGWVLPNMDNFDASDDPTYQVVAVEVFNPANSGTATGRVWDATEQ